MKNVLNNIAVVVGVLDGTTHVEVKVSLNKEDLLYTVWKTISGIKNTQTLFNFTALNDQARAVKLFIKELTSLGYELSITERSIIEMRLRNEANDDMDVVCFGEAPLEKTNYEDTKYASVVALGWSLGVKNTEKNQIEYRELDSFPMEGGRITRLFQLKHPDYLEERFLIRNCLIWNEPTATESILAMENTPEIFAVAYKDKVVGWESYMQAKVNYDRRRRILAWEPGTNLSSCEEIQTKEQQALALQSLVVQVLEQSSLDPEYWSALSYAKKALAAFPK